MATLLPRGSQRNVFQLGQKCNPTVELSDAQRNARELKIGGAIFNGAGCDPGATTAGAAIVAYADGAPVVELDRERIRVHLNVRSITTATERVSRALAHFRRIGSPLIVETARGVFDITGYLAVRAELAARAPDLDGDPDAITELAREIIERRAGRPVPRADARRRRPPVSVFDDPDEAARRWLARLDHERKDLAAELKRERARAFHLSALRQLDRADGRVNRGEGHGESPEFGDSRAPATELGRDELDRESPNFGDSPRLLLGIADARGELDGDPDELDGAADLVFVPAGVRDPDDGDERGSIATSYSATATHTTASFFGEEKEPVAVASSKVASEETPLPATRARDRVKNPTKFAALAAGRWREYYPRDESHAAMALLLMLARAGATGADELAAELAGSGLCRDRHASEWFGQQIATALRDVHGIEIDATTVAAPVVAPAPAPTAEELARRAEDAARATRARDAFALAARELDAFSPLGIAEIYGDDARAEYALAAYAFAGIAAEQWSEMLCVARLMDATNGLGRELGREVCERLARIATTGDAPALAALADRVAELDARED